ncbi:MAG TPA: hypothetical protein VFA78_01890 [Chloroflexota bacterium]|nr:hypothetical protein [Chloroflexota bacterium]
MTETIPDRQRLLARKADLYHAIDVLRRDLEDGLIDPDSYDDMRRQYELEAAGILAQLDTLPAEKSASDRSANVTGTWAGDSKSPARPHHQDVTRPRRIPYRANAWLIGGALAIVAAAGAILLITALHPRSGTQSITGSAGQPSTSPVQIAQSEVRAHPKSYVAYVRLGQAEQAANHVPLAEQAYRHAVRLNPHRPEAPTLQAMILIANGRRAQGMKLLMAVKRSNPGYARAWLLDGLAAAHYKRYRARALHDWQTFLRLQPSGPVAKTVRQLIKAERKVK